MTPPAPHDDGRSPGPPDRRAGDPPDEGPVLRPDGRLPAGAGGPAPTPGSDAVGEPRGAVRDLSSLRRRAAAEAVAHFLADLDRLGSGVPHRVVEGSAVAAQVRFTDEQLVRAVLRVDVAVTPANRDALETRLRGGGYEPGDGSGDVALMRIAGRRGRRPVHVLFEGRDVEPGPRHHPASPEARAERSRRLAQAFRPILATWRITHERPGTPDEPTVTETREVHLVDETWSPRGTDDHGVAARASAHG